jgi:GxxExxY protein
MTENEIGTIIIDRAVNIHKALGRSLLESAYEAVLAIELEDAGLRVERQVLVPFIWKGRKVDKGFVADMIVDGKVIVELKAAEKTIPAFARQLNTYLKLSGLKLGYMLNFGGEVMKDGIVRIVNGLEE